MKRLLLTATITLALTAAACTRSSVHNGIEGSAMRLSLDVSQSDFLTDSTETEPQTRATETVFQIEDVIGLFVHTTATAAANAGNHSSNVKYVAKDAISWQAAGGLGGELLTGTDYKVTAYYPYKANASNATAIDHWVAADQSAAYNAVKAGALELSDFMSTAPATITGNFATAPAVALTFSHRLAKLVVNVGVPSSIESVNVDKVQSVTIKNLKTKCTINIATGSILSSSDVQDITPRLVEGTGAAGAVSKWEAIVVPQTVAAGTLMVRIVCLMKDATTKELIYTVPAAAPLTIEALKKLTLTLSSAADLAITKGLNLIDGVARTALELGVKATAGVKWTLTSPAAWITLSTDNTTYASSITGTGTGAEQLVYVAVGTNPSLSLPRSATLTLSDAGGSTTIHDVVQNYFSFNSSINLTPAAGEHTIAAAAFASNQVWNAASSSAALWFRLATSATYGSGSPSNKYGPHIGSLAANALYYQVAANNTNAIRSATISYISATPGSAPTSTIVAQAIPVVSVSPSQSVAPHITSTTFNVTATNHKGVTYTPAVGVNATSVTPSAAQTINTTADYTLPVTVGFTQNAGPARNITATVKYGTSLTSTHIINQAASALTISATSASVAATATSATAFTITSNVPFTPSYTTGGGSNLGDATHQPASGRSITMTFPAQGAAPAAARTFVMGFTPRPDYSGNSQVRFFTTTQAAVPPALTISSSGPGVTIPKAGLTYYYIANVNSNTKWDIETTNTKVHTHTTGGNVPNFNIQPSQTESIYARTVSVTFTTTDNAGQAAVTRTWSGTQEGLTVPAGCFSTAVPHYPFVFVTFGDHDNATWDVATRNCADWGGRLPTYYELYEIYQSKALYGPFTENYYWTSSFSEEINGVSYYSLIYFTDGRLYHTPGTHSYHVRCVKETDRGYYPTPLPGFPNTYVLAVDYNEGHMISLTNAVKDCALWGGRLATKDELVVMYNNKASYGTFVGKDYWSSTPSDSKNHYTKNFQTGSLHADANINNNYYVRCVKTI